MWQLYQRKKDAFWVKETWICHCTRKHTLHQGRGDNFTPKTFRVQQTRWCLLVAMCSVANGITRVGFTFKLLQLTSVTAVCKTVRHHFQRRNAKLPDILPIARVYRSAIRVCTTVLAIEKLEFQVDSYPGRPPLWPSGQSSWLQIQRSGFDFRRYQIFWEVVGLERGLLNLVSTTEELHGRKSSGSGLEIRKYGRRDPSRWPRGTFYPQNLALTSSTSGCSSRTQATEFSFFSYAENIVREKCRRLSKEFFKNEVPKPTELWNKCVLKTGDVNINLSLCLTY
jgi:hypothetical protein